MVAIISKKEWKEIAVGFCIIITFPISVLLLICRTVGKDYLNYMRKEALEK